MNDDLEPELREAIEKAFAQVDAHYAELEGESARAATILILASIEDELAHLIRKKFPTEMSAKIWKTLCGSGPLGNFKAKNDIAHAFGFYGLHTHAKLQRLSEIRNRFAHASKPRSFLDEDIMAICHALGMLKTSKPPTETDVRWFFTNTAKEIHKNLELMVSHIPEIDPPLKPLP